MAWWLLVSHLVVGCGAVIVLLLTGVLDRDLRWQTVTALEGQAHAWALSLGGEIVSTGETLGVVAARAQPRLAEARLRTHVGLQIVDRDARVVASASPPSDTWLGDAPEVVAALAGEIGTIARARPTVRGRDALPLDGPSRFGDVRLFVAVPVLVDGQVVGAIVVSRTARAQLQALAQIGSPLVWRLLGIVGFAVIVALTAGYFGSRSLRRLARAADAISTGSSPPQSLRALQRSHVAEVGTVAGAVESMGLRLKQRTDGAEAFAGNAAHEFRTPIATLRGTLELMRDDPTMADEQRERFLDNGIAELLRLDALVGGLLDLGRAQRATVTQSVDLDALLERVAEAHGVTVQGTAGLVVGSVPALEIVVGNLLDNAAQHGGAEIVVRAWRSDREAGFEVIDDGAGISEETQGRLFDRFFTTDRQHGVGLGLCVVQGLVQAQSGRLAVHSEPGRTCFSVTLALDGRKPPSANLYPGSKPDAVSL